ncbi:MAG TPA: Na+/H+ antiporter NhaA, partial [Paludibacter sp.]|nr:Na+/H+ antiporter NhaA [Paludibacter sp.]
SGLAMLCGIGFTVSLFMAGLSYELGSDMLNDAKLGIIFGSVASGIVGYFILKMTLKKAPHEPEAEQE